MLIVDLSGSAFGNLHETLDRMVREGVGSVQDVEEGEISDSASVEEISEEDFKKPEMAVSDSNSNSKQRVWTMQELYNYSISRKYTSGLYNFAWAQAVKNKSLDEVLMMEFKPNDNSNLNRSSSSSLMNDSGVNEMAIDVSGFETEDAKMESEKEEGELEEGEIDLDSEVGGMIGEVKEECIELDENASNKDGKAELLEQINSIRQALESVTLEDAEKSFLEVCSRLHNSFDALRELFSKCSVPKNDVLIQLTFATLQIVYSVFCSMNENEREYNKDYLLRLLVYVRSQNPPLLTSDQMKKIEIMTLSLDSGSALFPNTDSDFGKHINGSESTSHSNYDVCDLASSEDYALDSESFKSSDENHIRSESPRLGLGNSKGRGALLPLLDLHKDHDVDLLPSPTRDTTPFLPIHKMMAAGAVVKPELLPLYEKDAHTAVSSYQQRFIRSSSFSKDRLPSPTPSGECDSGDGDTSGEVSSSPNLENLNSAFIPKVTCVSSVTQMDILGGQGIATSKSAGSSRSSKSSGKSRDPRLRFSNTKMGVLDLNQSVLPGVNNAPNVEPPVETLSSRKHKTVTEPVLDGPALKRQRSGSVDSTVVCDMQPALRSGSWLEDRGTVVFQPLNKIPLAENTSGGGVPGESENEVNAVGNNIVDVITTRNGNLPVTSPSTTASLNSLLKDIAVNPAIWMNIIKMEQQKISDPAKSTTSLPNSNSMLDSVPSVNVALPKPSSPGQGSAGVSQTPQTPQTAAIDDSGKIRMKPRDPRRVLHTVQKSGRLGSDQFKTTGIPSPSSQGMKGNINVQNIDDQSDNSCLPSQSNSPPDIAQQFTNNLKSIADIVSVSQMPISPIVSQIPSSQPVPDNASRVDVKCLASESENQQSGSPSPSQEVKLSSGQSPNAWGDVEHLFEGYDDQQKAAIQRERARRIGEQKKMFASRKLCLVLDLDHTLLNSAKFVEVDPIHDEILRKKEEQDREKPHRQLFRFPHLGMWTKLRPGIWNFLEKASKLFELHLYTMGNKLYATEMAKLLDPKGTLFAGRVISRGDDGDYLDGDERIPKSKDLEGVLGMESGVVIIDDSIRVWPHNKLNLIVVERYIYFPCSRRQFGLLGPSLLEIDHDERPEDGTLASSLAVIERMHQIFFAHRSLDEADVRNILASEQRKILGGCKIMFSRVFPVGEANPHLHPLWQTAEQFGALCTNQIDEQVTHVVANSLGTDKVNWAFSTGRFVVHPGWVEASALLYRRANEHDFAIKP